MEEGRVCTLDEEKEWEVSFSAYSLREVVIKRASLENVRSTITGELANFFSNIASECLRKRPHKSLESFHLPISSVYVAPRQQPL